jgi:hypothetical protein
MFYIDPRQGGIQCGEQFIAAYTSEVVIRLNKR